jgi:hypothetical protein
VCHAGGSHAAFSSMVRSCWDADPTRRPSFLEVSKQGPDTQRAAGYVHHHVSAFAHLLLRARKCKRVSLCLCAAMCCAVLCLCYAVCVCARALLCLCVTRIWSAGLGWTGRLPVTHKDCWISEPPCIRLYSGSWRISSGVRDVWHGAWTCFWKVIAPLESGQSCTYGFASPPCHKTYL